MENTKEGRPPRPSLTAREAIILVEVGQEGLEYRVHKALLIHDSEYFRKALNGPWKEAEEGKVSLKDVETGTFNIFVDWLYTRKLPNTREDWCEVAEIKAEENIHLAIESRVAMVKAIALGDRLAAASFKEAVNYSFVDFHYQKPSSVWYRVVIEAFNLLPSGNPILDFLVDCQCMFWKETYDDDKERELEPELPNEFLIRTMHKFGKMRDNRKERKLLDKCSYHEHASEEERTKCQK